MRTRRESYWKSSGTGRRACQVGCGRGRRGVLSHVRDDVVRAMGGWWRGGRKEDRLRRVAELT